MTKKFSDFTVPVSPVPAFLAGYNGLTNLQIPVGVANGIPYIDSAGHVQPASGLVTSVGPEFIFTPAAPQNGNVYGNWAQLMAVIASTPVEHPTIIFTADFTIPAGTWNLRRGVWRSSSAITSLVTVTIPDTAIIDNLQEISLGLIVSCTPSTPHNTFTFSANTPGTPALILLTLGSILSNQGSVPLVTLVPGEVFIIALLQSNMSLFLAPTAALVRGVVGSIIIGSDIVSGVAGSFPNGWVDGNGSLGYQAGVDFILPSIPGWVGTVSVTKTAQAFNSNYSPAVPSNWNPPPVQVAEALDQLASILPVVPPLTYVTPPTLTGQLYAYVGDATVDLAKADALSTCQSVAGVYNGTTTLSSIEGIPFSVRFEPGLTLVGGEPFYISSTVAGLSTNVEPSVPGTFSRVGGSIVDASGYNTLDPTGSVALCSISPQSIVAIV